MEESVDANVGEPVYNCMSCNGWWHESCMSASDRQTLPSELIANVEDGAAPPWRCQECVKKDQYAVQRVLEVVRGDLLGRQVLLAAGVPRVSVPGGKVGKSTGRQELRAQAGLQRTCQHEI